MKKLLALLLLFGIVGCSQELEVSKPIIEKQITEIALDCGSLSNVLLNIPTGKVTVTSPLFENVGYATSFSTSPDEYIWENRPLIELRPSSTVEYARLNRKTLILKTPASDGSYFEKACVLIDTADNKI